MSESRKNEIFTSLDLELNQQPTGPKIIQIGAVVGNITTGAILDKVSIFVDPKEQLTPFIIKLTKIKQEQVDGAHSLRDAYDILRNFHKRHESFVNPVTWGGGDTVAIKEELRESSDAPWCFGRRWIDVKTLYVSWRVANGIQPAGGLSRACRNLGLKFVGCAHRADDDAENTFNAYVKLLSFYKEKK